MAEGKYRKPDEQEIKYATSLMEKIKQSGDVFKDVFDRHKKNKRLVAGYKGSKKEMRSVNIIRSSRETLHAHMYASNPEISVSPKQRIDGEGEEYIKIGKTSETLEILVNALLAEQKLEQKGAKWVKQALDTKLGWLKVTWIKRNEKNSEVEGKINNLEEQLAGIDVLNDEIKNDKNELIEKELEYEKEEAIESLDQQIETLQKQLYEVVENRLSISVIDFDNMRIDPAVRSYDRIRDGRWIAQSVPTPVDDAKRRFPHIKWSEASAQKINYQDWDETPDDNADDSLEDMVLIWEFWNKEKQRVYSLCDGIPGYLEDSYTPKITADGFYPYFPLGFDAIEGEVYPRSLTETLEDLDAKYNETHDKLHNIKLKYKSMTAVNGAHLDPNDKKKIEDGTDLDFIALTSTNPDAKAADMIGHVPMPIINMGLFDTSALRYEIELVSGIQDAQRGAMVKAKTATEAEIMQQGLVSRISVRRGHIEAVLGDIANYVAGMAARAMSDKDVRSIAGESAWWSKIDNSQPLNKLSIKVRAGSTGKPNQKQERENWTQIYPVLNQLIVEVAQLQAQGAEHVAQAKIKLAKETLSRMGETVDIESFLPQQQQEQPPLPPANRISGQQITPEMTAMAQQQQQNF